LEAYRARLVQVRALVDRSRGVGTADREAMLTQAAALLRQTTALQTHGEAVPIESHRRILSFDALNKY